MDVAIVDDDENVIQMLNSFFDRFADEEKIQVNVTAYQNPNLFIMEYKGQFDLVCLDIDMPQMNGLDTAAFVRRTDDDVLIVFITNLAQYALNAYKVNAIDYILKPVKYGDFRMKVSKVLKYVRQKEGESIAVTVDGQTYVIETNSIYYIEVMTHYITIHLWNRDFKVRASLNYIESKLPACFVRCANSYLVNLKYIEEVGASSVKIKGGVDLPLTRSRKSEFMTAFSNYVGGGR